MTATYSAHTTNANTTNKLLVFWLVVCVDFVVARLYFVVARFWTSAFCDALL